MRWIAACLCVFAAASVTCDTTCPDGSVCTDSSTCCETPQGYRCCPYPHAVCCADMAHCCPPGFRCDHSRDVCDRVGVPSPWMYTPSLREQEGGRQGSDPHPEELSKTPVTPLTEAGRGTQEVRVIRCDSEYFCSAGSSCCKGPKGQWNCCPYPLGICCLDGVHCCEYGYTCDPLSSGCRGFYTWVPPGRPRPAQTD